MSVYSLMNTQAVSMSWLLYYKHGSADIFWVSIFISFGYISSSEIAELLGRTSILFSVVAAPIYNPTSSAQRFPFLNIHASICCLLSFHWWPILTSIEWYVFVVLICTSLVICNVEHLFIYLLTIWISSWKNVYSNPLLSLNWIFFSVELYELST